MDTVIAAAQESGHRLENGLVVIHKEDMRFPARIGLRNIKRGSRCGDRLARQCNRKTGAACGDIPHENRATVLRDDSITDAQAKAGSLPDWFGSVERIEN